MGETFDGERVSVALNLSPFDAWNRRYKEEKEETGK